MIRIESGQIRLGSDGVAMVCLAIIVARHLINYKLNRCRLAADIRHNCKAVH